MKILLIVHRYIPYNTGGTEIYTSVVANELSKYHDVYILTRITDPRLRNYSFIDSTEGTVSVRRINKITADHPQLIDRFTDRRIEDIFRDYVESVLPDLVHVQHLAGLSMNIINTTKEVYKIPVLFTVHDFYLFCLNGQFYPLTKDEICPAYLFGKCDECLISDIDNKPSTQEIEDCKSLVKSVMNQVDKFIFPSEFLLNFFEKKGIQTTKLFFLPNGYRTSNFIYRHKNYNNNSHLVFGFFGRINHTKGIELLLKAFSKVKLSNIKLKIYGTTDRHYHDYLSTWSDDRITFLGAYNNTDVNALFDYIDVLIVPSIWHENSPLVIHEAILSGVPVIASKAGGITELLENPANGVLFSLGNTDELAALITEFGKNPERLNFYKPNLQKIFPIEQHVRNLNVVYDEFRGINSLRNNQNHCP